VLGVAAVGAESQAPARQRSISHEEMAARRAELLARMGR